MAEAGEEGPAERGYTSPIAARSRSPFRRRLVVLLVALAVWLVVADVGVSLLCFEDGLFLGRPLPPFGAVNHPKQARWLAAELEAGEDGDDSAGPGVFDPELGWTLTPGTTSSNGRAHTNSAGARGTREYAETPPEGVTRLVCVGDSFTYCSVVADGDTWQARIEELAPDIEALNFGCGGYGTDQALLRWRRDGKRFAPRVVCLGLLVENIGRNVNRYRPMYFPSSISAGAKPRFVLAGDELRLVPLPFANRAEFLRAIDDGSVVERLGEHEYWLEPDLGLLRYSSFARLALGWRAYARRQPERLWSRTEGEPFRVTLALISALSREARAAGAEKAVVLVFPREEELAYLARKGEKTWQTLLDALTALGLAHIDLADTLLPSYRADPRDFYGGAHLGPRANGLVAERVTAWVREAFPH